ATHDIMNATLQTPNGPIPLTRISNPAISANVALSEIPDVDLSNPMLTDIQRKEILDLIREFDDLWRGGCRGKAVDVEHRIRVLTDRPISSRPRHITEEQKKIIKEEVDKMLKEGVIRPSSSRYASEVVLVKKKTGDWRFCIDFRQLNKITIPDKYPLPRIADLVRAVQNSWFFAAINLRAGYWQIPMEKESIKYTAFRCFLGLYEFVLMPFGLTNAPATFQRVVDFLFNDLRFSGVLCYIDDILVHSTTFEQFVSLLRVVFSRLRAAGLTLNLPKSHFIPRKLKYLGQIIVDGKLIPDPGKVEALKRIKPPTNISDVRSLLGFLGYYHSFIRDYAQLLAPVFDLLRNHKNTKRQNKTTAVS
ncbi:MAG: reverse transcriptase family protein, partial [Sphingobacterium sp.]